MNDLYIGNGEWRPVKLGPEMLGWIGPHIPETNHKITFADITVLMGNHVLPLSSVALSMQRFSYAHPSELWKSGMLNYRRGFTVCVPVGSVDVTDYDDGEGLQVKLSARSMDTLEPALSKLFSTSIATIQSEFHALRTPLEVVRKYAELTAFRYPKERRQALSWRGRMLSEVSQGTKARVRTILQAGEFDVDNHSALWKLESIPPHTSFDKQVDYQIRPGYDRARFSPQNVFIIKAHSDEEYEEGKKLLRTRHAAERYLTITPEMQDASFFLCSVGDPLEEWIDGQELSLKEFAAAASKET